MLDVGDPLYERKYEDMQNRLDDMYCEIEVIENNMAELQARIQNIQQQKISASNVYQFLLYFDNLYDQFTDMKKAFINSFVEQVDIYDKEEPDGRFLKHIKFRFPAFFDAKKVTEISWDENFTHETVVLMSRT